MHVWKLDRCFLCMSLRFACLIIGFAEAIEASFLLLAGISITAASGCGFLHPQDPTDLKLEDGFNDLDSLYSVLIGMAFFVAILVIVIVTTELAFSITLIIGVYKKKAVYLKAWALYKIPNIIMDFICSLIFCYFVGKWYLLGFLALSLSLDVYSLLAVISYYTEIKPNKQMMVYEVA